MREEGTLRRKSNINKEEEWALDDLREHHRNKTAHYKKICDSNVYEKK